MEVNIQMTWMNYVKEKPIKKQDKHILAYTGTTKAMEMYKKGFVGGKLIFNIDYNRYEGWWKMTLKD